MPDAPHDLPDLNALGAAVDQLAPVADEPRALSRDTAERALTSVLATLLGGLALAALGGLTGVLSLNVAAIVVGLLAAGGAGWGLMRLGQLEERRAEAAVYARERAQATRDAARGELLHAVDGVVAHVDRLVTERERLGTERARLHGRIDRLERRLAAKERKIARLQAFDAERRTLEPAPPESPLAGQLTFDAVSE